jgi:hypothetical protein
MLRVGFHDRAVALFKAAFFSVGFFWTWDLMTISNSWDYVFAHMITMISGLGLCLLLIREAVRAYHRRITASHADLPIKQPKNCGSRCG